jgi:predicted  nucleic acid-binding Zn-ribbon protein
VGIQATIAILKTLEVVDTRIRLLSVELSEKRSNMDEKSERHVALVTKIAGLEAAMEGLEGTRSELQGELRQLTIQVEKAREKMSRCRNEREANAAQRELAESRRLARDREFEIQKLIGLIDEARADLARIEEERAGIAEQIDETQGIATEKVREIESELAAENKKRNAAMSELPSNLRARYEAVTKHRGSGVAAAVDGSCTSCHISISPMIYQEVMRGQELHQCPSCHRILYYAEVAPDLPGSNKSDDLVHASPGSPEDAAAEEKATGAEGDESASSGG